MTDFTTQTLRLEISESYPFREEAKKDPKVQSLLDSIQKSIKESLKPFMFDFNDDITRNKIKNILTGFLDQLPTRKFRVECNTDNNTTETIDNNELHVDIWVQPIGWIQDDIPILVTMTSTGTDFSELA